MGWGGVVWCGMVLDETASRMLPLPSQVQVQEVRSAMDRSRLPRCWVVFDIVAQEFDDISGEGNQAEAVGANGEVGGIR